MPDCKSNQELINGRCYKKCNENQERNTSTMRCRKKSPKKSPKPKRTPARVPGGYIPQATPTCNSDQAWFIDKCYKKCKPNQKRSPKTKREKK